MNIVRHFTMLAVAAASLSCTVSAQETEIARKDVPPAVLASLEKAYPSAKVLEWEKEIHGGKLYYEAETVDGKVPRNILYSPDGTVVQIEEKIAADEIPTAVADAAKRQYPNATIRSAHKIIHGDTLEYALALTGGKQRKVAMHADGTIASSEGKTAIDRK